MPADFYEQMDRAGILDRRRLTSAATPGSCEEGDQDYTGARLARCWALGADDRRATCATTPASSTSAGATTPRPRSRSASRCRLRGGRLPGPADRLGRVQERAALGPSGEKEGPYDWVPPSYWYDTTHYDPRRPDPHQRRRRLGVRQRGERRRHGADARLDQALPVAVRAGAAVAGPRLQPVPPQLRGRAAEPDNAATRSARCTTSTRRSRARYGPWSSLASTSRRPRCRTTRPSAPSSRPTSTTPRRRRPPPASSTGSSTRAGRRCCGTSTTTTATRPAATSARRRPTSRCTPSTPTTPAPCRSTTSAAPRSPGCRSRRGSTTSPARCSTTRRASGVTVAAGRRRRTCSPEVPAATAPPAGRADVLRRAAAAAAAASVIDRNVYWLSTQPDMSTGRRRSATPQATMTQYADLSQLQIAAAAPSQRHRAHVTRGAGRAAATP